jgi:hypothetical protein
MVLPAWSSILHVSIRRQDSGSRFFRRGRTKETISPEKVKTQEATSLGRPQEATSQEGRGGVSRSGLCSRRSSSGGHFLGEAGLRRPLLQKRQGSRGHFPTEGGLKRPLLWEKIGFKSPLLKRGGTQEAASPREAWLKTRGHFST